jgi:chemotaxis protein MotB
LHADGVSVTVRDSDVVVSMSDSISFPSGSADLLPTALPLLGRIGALAAALPDCSVEVAGHTDDVPIHTGAFPSNLELSLARAARVVRELAIASPGLEGRMITTGFGEHRPLVPNADAEGRAQNRRVEIRFIPR